MRTLKIEFLLAGRLVSGGADTKIHKFMEESEMDIKDQISKMAEELSRNPDIREQFEKEPVKVIEKVIGIDLPDDVVMKIIDGVKAKLTIDNVSKAADALKGIFK